MKLSIIVPVYNTEKYIVRCIVSLLCQDFDDYEIIIVNDGTTDKAMEVLCENVHSNKIIVKNQQNGGLSYARNEGLKLASGEYVWFVDSDDWINDNCLKGICSELDNCDVLYFNQYYESSYSSDVVVSKAYNDRIGRTLCKKDVMVATHSYIYRRDFLVHNDLSFAVGLFHEDNLFTSIALYTAQTVKPYNLPVYHRFSNPESITHTIMPKRCYDLMSVAEKQDKFAKMKVSDSDLWEWGHFVADTINGALALSLRCDSGVRRDLNAFINSHRDLLDYLCNSSKIPTRIMGLLAKKMNLPLVSLYQFLSIFRYKLLQK